MSFDVETHAHAHTHSKGGHSWVDMAVALSALMVSVISLGVAIFHGRTMEQMADANARLVQANSWPFLRANSSNVDASGRPEVSLTVENDGVGPAKVHWLEVSYRGAPVGDTAALVKACCTAAAAAAGAASFNSSIVDNTVVRAGQGVEVLSFPRTARNGPLWDRLNHERFAMSYRACYCSVFDECWIGELDSLTTRPVRTCPAPAKRFDVLSAMVVSRRDAPSAAPSAPAPAGGAR